MQYMISNIKKAVLCFSVSLLILSGCSTLSRQQNQALMEILDILESAIAEAEDMLKSNPDPTSQFGDVLEKLNSIKDVIYEIQRGNAPYDEKRLSEYMDKIQEIEANIRNAVDKVFSSDVFFGLGKYKIEDLSDEGRNSIQEFTRAIAETQVNSFRKVFPDRCLVIVLKAVGYADETPLGDELSEILKREISGPLPDDPEERKKMLNQKLSWLRARSISEHIQQQLESMPETENIVIGLPDIQGMGEEYPYAEESADPPYQSQDERRRICKIYSRILVDSQDSSDFSEQ